MHTPRSFALPLFVTLMLGAAPPLLADGPVLVTVTGTVENTNRGAVNPDEDKLFVFNDVAFEKAMEFDVGTLEALPQTRLATDFPKGGDRIEFAGPLLADVLAHAGATGTLLTLQAMDGYAVEVPTAELIEKGAVLALTRNGKPLGIGGFGPAQIVFPRADRPDLADMPDDWWIWQIYHINVK